MKFIPILFSSLMVNALLNGRKTQTRRTIKLDEFYSDKETAIEPRDVPEKFQLFVNNPKMGVTHWDFYENIKCKFGEAGDVLWVRETWTHTTNIDRDPEFPWGRFHSQAETENSIISECTIYRADGEWQWLDEHGAMTDKTYWKPNIFMPKKACRLFFEITAVRAERLQQISQGDAISEGALMWPNDPEYQKLFNEAVAKQEAPPLGKSPVQRFESLWKDINGEPSWNSNPWVWVIEFKKIDKPENFI